MTCKTLGRMGLCADARALRHMLDVVGILLYLVLRGNVMPLTVPERL